MSAEVRRLCLLALFTFTVVNSYVFFLNRNQAPMFFFTKLASAEAEIISVYMTIFTKRPSTIHCLPATAA